MPQLHTAKARAGVACREGSDWRVHGLFGAPEGQATDYRRAAGNDPQLAAMIDSMIAEDPFDAAQEKAAMDEGWRQSAAVGTID